MLKKLLICLGILGVIVGVLAVIVALRPGEFRVERTATIAAPPAIIFAEVNDFHQWEAWSPWLKIDPNSKNTYEGPASGKGAIFKWSGNDQVGEGQMTLTESKPNELIKIKLEFIRPMQNTCDVQFTFKPDGDKTVVTWTMSGRNNFTGKAVHMVMDIEKLVGTDFEKGLASMKAAAEAKKAEAK